MEVPVREGVKKGVGIFANGEGGGCGGNPLSAKNR